MIILKKRALVVKLIPIPNHIQFNSFGGKLSRLSTEGKGGWVSNLYYFLELFLINVLNYFSVFFYWSRAWFIIANKFRNKLKKKTFLYINKIKLKKQNKKNCLIYFWSILSICLVSLKIF